MINSFNDLKIFIREDFKANHVQGCLLKIIKGGG